LRAGGSVRIPARIVALDKLAEQALDRVAKPAQ
jgi:hypothetical protein